jgi:hypothetical protein
MPEARRKTYDAPFMRDGLLNFFNICLNPALLGLSL